MSPGLIELEVTDFVGASVSLAEDVVAPVAAALSSLGAALGGCGGMAGGDPAGLEWARQYDAGAAAVLAASADAANGCGRLSAMFPQTARNWAAAEAASTAGHGSPELCALPCVVAVSVSPGPGAAGVGSVGPSGWELIAHLVDCVWPNGHQDRLHRAAEAWDACALVLQDRSDFAATAAILAQLDRLPEADDMRTACWVMCHHLRDLASAQRSLAAACRAYAARLDSVHAQVIDELESLAEWSAGIQAVGALFSVFTAGVAQVPTHAVQASRIAACAARVSELIAGFVASARGLAATLPSVADLAESVALGLRPLLGTRLAVAGVTDVRALPSMTRAARMEMAAEGRLAANSTRAAARRRLAEISGDRGAVRLRAVGDGGVPGGTSNVAKMSQIFRHPVQQIRIAIHLVKKAAAHPGNPDMIVDRAGEVYPIGKDGRAGESIGNILDYLGE